MMFPLALAVTSAASVPSVTLNNGVVMPMISCGTWQYDVSTAEKVVKLALSLGFNHIDTANDYRNQRGVGAGLKGVNRSSYFLTTKVPSQTSSRRAYSLTKTDLYDNLDQLGLDYVDLLLLHFPPVGNTRYCAAMQEQWRAAEDFYAAGKARAIGVSNYCPTSFECIFKTANVTPAVNQVKYHVGMSKDPNGIKSYCDSKGVTLQAYSPLGDGTSELIKGPLVSGIGAAHNKTGAQVSLHWVYKHGVPLSTKATDPTYLAEDLAAVADWGDDVTDGELASLDGATSPSGDYSFNCQA
jgi:2,5-diketo-D-gluconate reductase A